MRGRRPLLAGECHPASSVRYNNLIWLQLSMIALIHLGVSRFNVFGEKLRIKQRRSKTIFS